MKAAVLRTIPGQLEIDDVTIDKPGPHEVLVRTAAAGVCHSDLHFVEGKYIYPTPCVLGHESAGVTEQVGDLATSGQPGDAVVACLSLLCGHCAYCLNGHRALCDKIGVGRDPHALQRLSQAGAP